MSYTTRYTVYSDGNDVHVRCHDAGEFSTYGRSRGPSSGSFSDDRPSASRQSRQDTYGYPLQGGYAGYGYPMQGRYAGEPNLRRRLSRSAGAYGAQDAYRRRSGQGEEVFGPSWRQETREQLKDIQREFQEAIERGRTAGDDSDDGRREQQQERRRAARDDTFDERWEQESKRRRAARDEERPGNVGRYGYGYFPAYEWR